MAASTNAKCAAICRRRAASRHVASFCPTGASLFGKLTDLQKEAETRISLLPAPPTIFRAGASATRPTRQNPGKIANYLKKVYGEKDGGGTQLRYIAGVSFEKLGLPNAADHSFAATAEGIQHTHLQVVRRAHRAVRRSARSHLPIDAQPPRRRRAAFLRKELREIVMHDAHRQAATSGGPHSDRPGGDPDGADAGRISIMSPNATISASARSPISIPAIRGESGSPST